MHKPSTNSSDRSFLHLHLKCRSISLEQAPFELMANQRVPLSCRSGPSTCSNIVKRNVLMTASINFLSACAGRYYRPFFKQTTHKLSTVAFASNSGPTSAMCPYQAEPAPVRSAVSPFRPAFPPLHRAGPKANRRGSP